MAEFPERSIPIRSQLRAFHRRFPWLRFEELLEYFAVYGGVEARVEFDFFEELEESIGRHFVREFESSARWLSFAHLRERPYRELLMGIARGDGKMLGAFRRARMGEGMGGALLGELLEREVLRLERSREAPIRPVSGRPIRKELRGYRIQDKVRFRRPFERFWFAFVEPYTRELVRGEGRVFMENYRRHRERAISLLFEQLSSELLALHFAATDPLLSGGSHWDYHSEFDLLAHTRSGRLILGECKYRGRPVCRKELNKLKEKAMVSGIRADTFVLFSRSGFSRELRESEEKGVLLFELKDFERLLEE